MISASMELVTELVNNQLTLCIPVALVLIGAILVFTFGFKSAEQPPFDKLSSSTNDDRKPAGKKRKTKEKKPTVNGHILNAGEAKTDKSPKRLTKEASENQKPDSLTAKPQADKKRNDGVKNKKPEKVEEIKIKKNLKAKATNQKPVDFDDGSWETVPTKGDKKKKQESPVKKDKKNKKVENDVATEKLEPDASPSLSEVDSTKVLEPLVSAAPEKEDAPVEVEIVAVEVKEENSEKMAEKEEEEEEDADEEPKVDVLQAVEVGEETVTQTPPPAEKREKQQEGSVAFDELGDLWTEAKVVKKSKKKSRREI